MGGGSGKEKTLSVNRVFSCVNPGTRLFLPETLDRRGGVVLGKKGSRQEHPRRMSGWYGVRS